MELERIKQRDKWTCKRCGHKFGDLQVCRFEKEDIEDNYITLCSSCLKWASDNEKEAIELFRKAMIKNKIVLVGDCHGHFKRLDNILTAEEPFDFFISVGDFANTSDIEIVENSDIINKWKEKGYFVYGNHDDIELLEPLALHQEIRGLTISGLNGIIRSRNFLAETPKNISFREVLYLSHLSDVDILVTHQPPTGVFKGMGEPVLEELLNYLVPRIYVFGHIHHYKLRFHLNTFIISLPLITKGHAIAYFQGKDLRNLEIVLKKGKKFIRV